MPNFSKNSFNKLMTCDRKLQEIFFEVIKHIDCTILDGSRTKEEQEEYFKTGKSKARWPESKHNTFPSLAVDAVPYPIDWEDKERMAVFIGFVLAVAAMKGIKIRSGIDWNMDTQTKDSKFKDYPHFELV